MKHWFSVILSLAVICALPSWANTGVNINIQKLLNEEADHYIQALDTAEGEELIDLAIELQDSGITDKRVLDTAEKVAIKLHEAYNRSKNRKLKKKRGDKAKSENLYKAAASLARFIAGSGNTDYFPTLDTFMRESKARSLRNLSKTLMTRTGWYLNRNQVMNDFSHHTPGQSLYLTRYINLFNADDRTFGRYAAESMKRQGKADSILVNHMARLVKKHYKNPGLANDLDAVAWYIRFIGREALDEHRALLEEVASYSKLDKKLKKHVNKALKVK